MTCMMHSSIVESHCARNDDKTAVNLRTGHSKDRSPLLVTDIMAEPQNQLDRMVYSREDWYTTRKRHLIPN